MQSNITVFIGFVNVILAATHSPGVPQWIDILMAIVGGICIYIGAQNERN